jgi:alpha-L-fucosidase
MMLSSLSCVVVVITSLVASTHCQYKPTWESLDSRPLPSWYDDAKFGIIMHWGLYSVPSFGVAAEWFWNYWKSGSPQYKDFMMKNYGPDFQYPDFAPMFKAEFFDPDVFSALVEKSGAK